LAEVAELHYQPVQWSRSYRYVVKRELAEKKTGALYWKYHVLVTNNEVEPAVTVMRGHLQHADMENAIKEHKIGGNSWELIGIESYGRVEMPWDSE
jgi:hypothetical protein